MVSLSVIIRILNAVISFLTAIGSLLGSLVGFRRSTVRKSSKSGH